MCLAFSTFQSLKGRWKSHISKNWNVGFLPVKYERAALYFSPWPLSSWPGRSYQVLNDVQHVQTTLWNGVSVTQSQDYRKFSEWLWRQDWAWRYKIFCQISPPLFWVPRYYCITYCRTIVDLSKVGRHQV